MLENGVTVITPTGDRLIPFGRCVDYVCRQTRQPNQWIVVDDGKESSENLLSNCGFVDYARRVNCTNKAKSLTGNLLRACDLVKFNKVIIMEDDDWYNAEYIEETLFRFGDDWQIVGEARTVYYNIQHRAYRINGNTKHASLCSTSFRGELLGKFIKACNLKRSSAFVDSRFWKIARLKKYKTRLLQDKWYNIGLKSLPGRNGIGIGHKKLRSYRKDNQFLRLKGFIGELDASFYINNWTKWYGN